MPAGVIIGVLRWLEQDSQQPLDVIAATEQTLLGLWEDSIVTI